MQDAEPGLAFDELAAGLEIARRVCAKDAHSHLDICRVAAVSAAVAE